VLGHGIDCLFELGIRVLYVHLTDTIYEIYYHPHITKTKTSIDTPEKESERGKERVREGERAQRGRERVRGGERDKNSESQRGKKLCSVKLCRVTCMQCEYSNTVISKKIHRFFKI
jgi:hypothetical protein